MDKSISEYMSEQGRKGGSVKSEAKAKTSAANGAMGGRPKLRRVSVYANYSKERGSVEIVLRDGQTATRRQYEDALRRLRAAEGDYLRLDNREEGEILVYDCDNQWAVIA